MPVAQFNEVMKREWVPVQLLGHAIPDWLRGIPTETLHSVYASGSFITASEYGDKMIPSGSLIGGYDVYRNAPDDPVNLNKDWYFVIAQPGSELLILVKKKPPQEEHWVDEIPNHLKGVEILGVPPLPEPTDIETDQS